MKLRVGVDNVYTYDNSHKINAVLADLLYRTKFLTPLEDINFFQQILLERNHFYDKLYTPDFTNLC